MQSGASYREEWATRSLMQRLAVLDNNGVLATNHRPHHFDAAQQAIRRRHVLTACFGLGFASSLIVGGIALLVLLFVHPGDTRINVSWSIAQARAAQAPSWFGSLSSNDNNTNVAVLVRQVREPAWEQRQVWWKLPMLDDH